MTMRLNIISPEGTLVDQEVDRVELPGAKGRFVVLKDHAPIVSSLVEGEIVFGGSEGIVHIKSGFVEVVDNQVIACVEL